ncbi:hypothetical protein WAF17_10035 [Bernardetia sp. ABR2-2B]|uniref:hypothetical protein n=1 Tax=Bernardetia sp. ABR2-2B TaxID=3127472 RepID=UPI0030D38E22
MTSYQLIQEIRRKKHSNQGVVLFKKINIDFSSQMLFHEIELYASESITFSECTFTCKDSNNIELSFILKTPIIHLIECECDFNIKFISSQKQDIIVVRESFKKVSFEKVSSHNMLLAGSKLEVINIEDCNLGKFLLDDSKSVHKRSINIKGQDSFFNDFQLNINDRDVDIKDLKLNHLTLKGNNNAGVRISINNVSLHTLEISRFYNGGTIDLSDTNIIQEFHITTTATVAMMEAIIRTRLIQATIEIAEKTEARIAKTQKEKGQIILEYEQAIAEREEELIEQEKKTKKEILKIDNLYKYIKIEFKTHLDADKIKDAERDTEKLKRILTERIEKINELKEKLKETKGNRSKGSVEINSDLEKIKRKSIETERKTKKAAKEIAIKAAVIAMKEAKVAIPRAAIEAKKLIETAKKEVQQTRQEVNLAETKLKELNVKIKGLEMQFKEADDLDDIDEVAAITVIALTEINKTIIEKEKIIVETLKTKAIKAVETLEITTKLNKTAARAAEMLETEEIDIELSAETIIAIVESIVNALQVSFKEKTALKILNSTLGNATFKNIDLSKFSSIEIKKVDLSSLKTFNSTFPIKGQIIKGEHKELYEIFNDLYTSSKNKNDKTEELDYYKASKNNLRKYLYDKEKSASDYSSLISLLISEGYSSFGTNFLQATIITVVISFMFFSLMLYNIGYTLELNTTGTKYFCDNLVAYWIQYINPVHRVDFMKEVNPNFSENPFFVFFDFMGRIFISIGIFETVRSFRKFV